MKNPTFASSFRAWQLALPLLLLAGVAGAQEVQTFPRGSLIIPMESYFQRPTGQTSAYGLVWRILQQNADGGVFEDDPVTIYWIINTNKQSPNRCVPHNLVLPPSPRTGWNDPRWNDGCDLTITNTGAGTQPVVQVRYNTAFPATGMYANGDLEVFSTSSSGEWPQFSAVTLNAGTSPDFHTIQYLGAPFVIDASDAKRVIDWLTGSGTPNDIRQFAPSSHCTDGFGRCFEVRMHQATVEFTAPVFKRINKTPPKLALLDAGGGVSSGILNDYLKNAGLLFPGAAGCPQGKTCTVNGTTTSAQGLIYDQFHAIDDLISTTEFPHGRLNAKDSRGKFQYRIFWAPHWEAVKSRITGQWSVSSAQLANALDNIAYFADQKGHGVLAECASLESFEGSFESGDVKLSRFTSNTQFQFTNAIDINGLSGGSSYNGRNCTDPDYSSGECVLYPHPAEPIAQIGSVRYLSTGGHVHNFRPYKPSSSTHRSSVKRLAISWPGYPAYYPSGDNTGNLGWDFFTLGQKDDDPEKATILYLAGHSYTGDLAGNRIVLNTLMNLGADPVSSDRSITAPVPFHDDNTGDDLMMVSTYQVVTGTLLPGTRDFTVASEKNWVFPFTRGDLRAHNVTGGNALVAGRNALDAAVAWQASEQIPRPQDRNLFTYFGGKVEEAGSLQNGNRPRNGIRQTGWVPAELHYSQINAAFDPTGVTQTQNADCVDVLKYGQAKDKGSAAARGGLVTGSDGICDLQQALMLSDVSFNSSDWAIAAVSRAALLTNVERSRRFIQLVRGHCWATNPTNYEPTSESECENPDAQPNVASLGGLVNSSAAIVPPSPNIVEGNARRPTVAYVGGYDGALHAIYVSGGSGYRGPSASRPHPNPSATSAFETDWSSRFSQDNLPAPGTELWAYFPASQLPWLRSNGGRVDSSAVVQDVFTDLTGSGVKAWYTILVISVGKTGRELFAFDVTNPLEPVLLWDVVGSNYQVSNFPAYMVGAPADLPARGSAQPLRWNQATTSYALPPVSDAGRTVTGAYDYSELGGSRGLALGQLRLGLEPVYAVFVAANSSKVSPAPAKGLVVYAIEAGTGQKLWEWVQPYTDTNRASDNTVPPVVSLRPGVDGIQRLFVGDMEGRVWELDARTGQNANTVTAAGCSPCKYAAADAGGSLTEPHPITSNLAIARIPDDATGDLSPYAGELAMVFGTAGADWVPMTAGGKIGLRLLEDSRRLPVVLGGKDLAGNDITASQARTRAAASGIFQSPADFPIALTVPERVYGYLTVAGSTVVVPVASGAIGDPLELPKAVAGKTYTLNLANVTGAGLSALAGHDQANFGGVAVMKVNDGSGNSRTVLVGTEVSQITLTNLGANSDAEPDPALNPDGGTTWRLMNVIRRFF